MPSKYFLGNIAFFFNYRLELYKKVCLAFKIFKMNYLLIKKTFKLFL